MKNWKRLWKWVGKTMANCSIGSAWEMRHKYSWEGGRGTEEQEYRRSSYADALSSTIFTGISIKMQQLIDAINLLNYICLRLLGVPRCRTSLFCHLALAQRVAGEIQVSTVVAVRIVRLQTVPNGLCSLWASSKTAESASFVEPFPFSSSHLDTLC